MNHTEEHTSQEATYRTLVSPRLMDHLKERIIDMVLVQKKYKDQHYSARQLAEDLGTNTRYISAVVRARFHTTYTAFVNKFRVEEAMALLADKRYTDLSIEEISKMVGFANRQSFYLAFGKVNGCTPREYRLRHKAPKRKK